MWKWRAGVVGALEQVFEAAAGAGTHFDNVNGAAALGDAGVVRFAGGDEGMDGGSSKSLRPRHAGLRRTSHTKGHRTRHSSLCYRGGRRWRSGRFLD